MTTPIGSLSSVSSAPVVPTTSAAEAKPKAVSSFGDSLAKLVDDVDTSAGAANSAVEKMLDGHGDVHEAMIALQRAELTLQLTVQMRNKLVQAYQEIMRMPV